MKRIIVAALVGALLLLGGGAQAATAIDRPPLTARCDAQRAGNTIVVTGQASSPGATSVSLRCTVYVNGQVIASFGSTGAGPTAVVAGTINNAPPGTIRVCTDASDGFAHTSFCG